MGWHCQSYEHDRPRPAAGAGKVAVVGFSSQLCAVHCALCTVCAGAAASVKARLLLLAAAAGKLLDACD